MASTIRLAGRMRLGEYLCKRLYAAGCHDVFGVPGDFTLGLFDKIIESDLRYVGCCNELNAAYAADGYARLRGLGCCLTTYAVGELSAINGIAGAYAECVPVVKICGGPARKFFKEMPLLHHTLGDYMTPYKMYQPITVDQCILNQPSSAAEHFERVLRNCLLYKRPVYVLVPSDMANIEIDIPEGYLPISSIRPMTALEDTTAPPASSSAPVSPAQESTNAQEEPHVKLWSVDHIVEPESCQAALKEAMDEVLARLQKAKRPVFLPGVELIRRGLQSEFYKLTTKSNIPYATMLLSKGLISESHPNFMGLYMGCRSSPEIRKAITESDCVIVLGEKLTDFNTGGFTSDFVIESRILVNFDEVQISNHSYLKVYIHDFMRKFVECVPVFPEPAYEYPRAEYACPNRRNAEITSNGDSKLTMDFVFKKLAKELPNDCVLIAETGASMFSAAETMLPQGGTYIGQVFYGSIGYTIGACLGACIAIQDEARQKSAVKGNSRITESVDEDSNPRTPPRETDPANLVSRRVILSIGDGSFQVTGQDLSTMIRYKCNPVVLLVNNDGYTIERVITDNIYNNIAAWKYHEIPRVFGAENNGARATTEEEFDSAITKAIKSTTEFCFIEAVVDQLDCNKLLKAAGRQMALNNTLTPSITEEMIMNSKY